MKELGWIDVLISSINFMQINKQKIVSETKAIFFIVLTVLLVKVTVLEAYIVPTGSMENTIMTGDFLIGSRFVYGMRTPDWIGIPYTDIGFFIPYYKFPEFKVPQKNDVLIFKYPRDKYVKYVKYDWPKYDWPQNTISLITVFNNGIREIPREIQGFPWEIGHRASWGPPYFCPIPNPPQPECPSHKLIQ